MPQTYHLPDGRVIHSSVELSPEDLDHLLSGSSGPSMFDKIFNPNKGLSVEEVRNKYQLPNKPSGELGRKDVVTFDMPMQGMYDKISNLTGKYLPPKLQWYGGALGSLAAYPLEVLKDIAAQPESPTIGAVAGIKSLAKTKNLKQQLESIPKQSIESPVEFPKSPIINDPNYNQGVGDPELAGSIPYKRAVPQQSNPIPELSQTSKYEKLSVRSSDPNLNQGFGDPELAGSTRYKRTSGNEAEQLFGKFPKSETSEASDSFHKAANNLFPDGNSPPLYEAETALHPVQSPEISETIPPPGNAKLINKDINVATANTGSADQVLESREITKPIVSLIRDNGWDRMQSEVGTNLRKLDSITSSLDRNQLSAFGRLAENTASEADTALLKNVPDLDTKLTSYRELMDDIFKKAKVARSGNLGYIQDYVTHVNQAPEDFRSGLQSIFNYRLGKDAFSRMFGRAEITSEGTNEASGIYGKGTGKIAESPFTKTRTNAERDIDYNVNRIGRMYIESMARETYLRPAVEAAKNITASLPDSNLKELAEWYIKNTTRFDAAPNLHKAMQRFSQFLINTTSRSLLGFNPHLQALHAMRLGPVWAELGNKYSAIGLGNMLKNPAAAYRETASLGLLPNEIAPLRFQTLGEKIESLGNFKSYIDFIDRSIAYNGFKQKYLDAGLTPEMAKQRAIVDAKRTTFQTDPSRAAMGLNPDYSLGGTAFRLAAQFKQVPAKIVEWVARTATDAKTNPAKAARTLALLGGTGAVKATTGLELFHMPTSLGDWSAASLNELRKITSLAVKGDVEGALTETALWLTPSGKNVQRLLK